jgi:riboflavin synthase
MVFREAAGMFTGIVECIAEIRAVQRKGALTQLSLSVPLDLSGSRVGDSFCIQGVCLTAVEISAHAIRVEVSRETLERTVLGSFAPGKAVNLERALKLSDPLGGHLVTGHVDGIGRLLEANRGGENVSFRFQADARSGRYLVEKGSICVDGVSLTLGLCEKDNFWVHLIPHTLGQTTLKGLRPGDRVNLEADIIGKYVEKILMDRGVVPGRSGGLDADLLEKHGFTSGAKVRT